MTNSGTAVRLIAVGDLQLGDSATCVGFGFRSRISDRALADALASFSTVVGRPDLAFANLETPLSDIGLDRHGRSRQLRGSPSYASVLRSVFTVLNVANNHALEHGAGAFRDSVSRIESLGIGACGRRGEGGWAARPLIQVIRGLRIGWLGYSLRLASGTAGDRLHAEAPEAEILGDVKRLRSQTHCVIVSLHWGEEFAERPSAPEVSLAHAIVDGGAAVILGHHPHVARPVERYGNGIIAYSLGNFAGDMIWHPPLRHGQVLDCTLDASGVASACVYRTHVEDSFLPNADQNARVPVLDAVSGLEAEAYVELARTTVRAQRTALYSYTLRNAWRFDPRVLVELAATTVRGKLSRLIAGRRDDIWG